MLEVSAAGPECISQDILRSQSKGQDSQYPTHQYLFSPPAAKELKRDMSKESEMLTQLVLDIQATYQTQIKPYAVLDGTWYEQVVGKG